MAMAKSKIEKVRLTSCAGYTHKSQLKKGNLENKEGKVRSFLGKIQSKDNER